MKDTTIIDYTTPQFYNTLFHSYSQPLCNFLYRRYGDWEKSKDITQESFIKLWDNRHIIAKKKAKNFLYKVANNAFLNTIAHDHVVHNHQVRTRRAEASVQDAPDYLMEEQEFSKKLNDAINCLTAKQKEVFLRNRIEKMKYKEIAVELGISIKTVEKRMHNALIILRKYIKEQV